MVYTRVGYPGTPQSTYCTPYQVHVCFCRLPRYPKVHTAVPYQSHLCLFVGWFVCLFVRFFVTTIPLVAWTHARQNICGVMCCEQDWTKEEIKEVYDMPMLELLYRASSVHRMFFDPTEVQQCTLLSIKTGGCTEDCGYCSQSVRHKTFVKPTPQMKVRTARKNKKRRMCFLTP